MTENRLQSSARQYISFMCLESDAHWLFEGRVTMIIFQIAFRISICIGLSLAISRMGVCAESLDAQTVRRGFSTQVFVDAQGDQHRYVLFVPHAWQRAEKQPEQKPPRKLPVLIFLNGLGQNGNDGVSQISNNFGPQVWDMQEFFPFLTIAPQCQAGSTWSGTSDDSRWAMEILDAVVREFGADTDRICLTGVSAGGSGVWNIGSQYADKFAALAPLCGNGGNLDRIAKVRLPVWNFINDGDRQDLVNGSRKAREVLIQQGQSPLFTEFHKSGHDCWNATYRLPALYAWLLEQRKSRNAIEPPFELCLPDQLLQKWRQQGTAVWKAGEEKTLVATSDAGNSLLISNRVGTDLELHADVWLEKGTNCQLAIVPEGDASTAGPLHIVLSTLDSGSGGVVWHSGSGRERWLSGLDLAAQQSFRPQRWNDVRVRLSNGRLTVRINGWPAADVEIASASDDGGEAGARYRLALVSGAGQNEVRWRYVRLRRLDDKRTMSP